MKIVYANYIRLLLRKNITVCLHCTSTLSYMNKKVSSYILWLEKALGGPLNTKYNRTIVTRDGNINF